MDGSGSDSGGSQSQEQAKAKGRAAASSATGELRQTTSAANPAALCMCGWPERRVPPGDTSHEWELHERIRVLEAELAEWKELYDDTLVGDGKKWKARVEELERDASECGGNCDCHPHAKARVEELEAEVDAGRAVSGLSPRYVRKKEDR